MIDAAAAPAAEAPAPTREGLAAMFEADLNAEAAPPVQAEPAQAVEETVSEPVETDEAQPQISEESPAEVTEAADPATQDPEPVSASVPSGMSEADKAVFAKLPPALQAWVSKREAETRADYTRKTQEVAEARKSVDNGLSAIRDRLGQYDAILSKFTQADIAPPDPALRNTDPIAFEDQMAAYVQAKHQKEVATKEQARVRAEYEHISKAQLQAYHRQQAQLLAQIAPEAGAHVLLDAGEKGKAALKSIFEYGKKAGYSEEQVNQAGAVDLVTLWKAQQFDAMKAAAKTAKPVPQAVPKVAAPGPAKAIGRPSNLSVAVQNLAKSGSRDALAAAYLAELNSERR